MRNSPAQAVDQASRDALHRFRLDAFDNVDVDGILDEGPVLPERARWIARHLLQHGRGVQAYRAGQRILTLLKTADVT